MTETTELQTQGISLWELCGKGWSFESIKDIVEKRDISMKIHREFDFFDVFIDDFLWTQQPILNLEVETRHPTQSQTDLHIMSLMQKASQLFTLRFG